MRGITTHLCRSAAGAGLAGILVLGAAGTSSAATPTNARLSGSTSAAAQTSQCTDSWVGLGKQPLWTIGKNWSTGRVPGPHSNVCITSDGVDVLTYRSIKIHSLLLGEVEGIALEGTESSPVTATVATFIDLTPGAISRIDMDYATINAAEIDDDGGIIFAAGTSSLNSPDIDLANGTLRADGGTVTLTSLSDLDDGALSGTTLQALGGNIVVPSAITGLTSTVVEVAENSAILLPSGDDALGTLASVDASSTFYDGSSIDDTNGLVSAGNVALDGQVSAFGGMVTQTAGVLSSDTNLDSTLVTVDPGATMELYGGTVGSDLTNEGLLDVLGTTTVTSSYEQSSGATLDAAFGSTLNATVSASITGAVISGELLPTTGDSTTIIASAAVTGAFTSQNLGFVLFTGPHQIVAVIQPQIAASSSTAAPGASISISGASFSGNVDIYLDNTSGTPLGSAPAGYFGRFQTSVTIPSSTSPGLHTLIAVGAANTQAETPVTVS